MREQVNTSLSRPHISKHANPHHPEWSRECWCGFSLAGSSSVNAIDCDYPCTGDSSQACGGPTRLTVYQSASRLPKVNPGVNGYSSIGCYSDSVTARVLGSSVQVPGGSSNNTVVGCTATCSALEYDYSGVEYAGGTLPWPLSTIYQRAGLGRPSR